MDTKLSVSRSPRLYSRLLLMRRTDRQHRFVWAAPDAVPARPSRKAHNAAGAASGGGQVQNSRTHAKILAVSGHVTTRSMSPQRRRSPMPSFASKKLSTGLN